MRTVFFRAAVTALSFGWIISANAQNHDITFKVGQVYRNTNKDPLALRMTDSKSVSNGFAFDLGYRYYFKNDNYLELAGNYSFSNYSAKSTGDWGTMYREMSQDQKTKTYGATIEFGKRLNYKFIDFLAGINAGFYTSPVYKRTDYYYTRDYSPSQGFPVENESRMVTSLPAVNTFQLALNTALYFRIYKGFSLGVEVGNGFSYSRRKGNEVTEATQIYPGSNTTGYITIDTKKVDDARLSTQFLRTQLALRYFFGIRKKDAVPVQNP